MVEAAIGDLAALDRDVARAWRSLESFRSRLATDPASAQGSDPFEGLRHVAGKSTFDALGELTPSKADVPLRDGLRRWVGVFVQSRIVLLADCAWGTQAAASRGRYAGDGTRLVSWHEAWRGVASSRSANEARLWLDAAADAGPPLADIAMARAGRRGEAARRMGWGHPWEARVTTPRGTLRDSAWRLLRGTEDLARSARKEAPEGEDAAAAFFAASAREASSGWPARLTPSWLREAFRGEPRDGAPKLGALPQPSGAASFARAMAQFGFAVRLALTPSSLPFALAREPAFLAEHRFGWLFGLLPADPEFHVRVLGLGRAAARAQARTLVKTALLEARVQAARLLLGDEHAFAPTDVHSELTVRLFGSPLDPRLRGAWPAPRDDEPARFIAMLQTAELRNTLRERFDVDWFHNPRAWGHFREESSGMAREVIDEPSLATSADRLAKELEGALG